MGNANLTKFCNEGLENIACRDVIRFKFGKCLSKLEKRIVKSKVSQF